MHRSNQNTGLSYSQVNHDDTPRSVSQHIRKNMRSPFDTPERSKRASEHADSSRSEQKYSQETGLTAKKIKKRFQLSLQAYILPVQSFSLATPTPKGCTQLPLGRFRLPNGRVTRDNSIVNDFYALAARWTVHAKTDS